MGSFFTNNTLVELWREVRTPLEYIFTFLVSVLSVIAFIGFAVIFYEIITNPSQFNNTIYGIFDYI
jgi:hypothetical protein